MRVHSALAASAAQALLVSNELIRVAILWAELWHESLEQSYRRYFYYEQQGVDAMLHSLAPLYRLLEQGAATDNERAFVAAHGADLQAQRALSILHKHGCLLKDASLSPVAPAVRLRMRTAKSLCVRDTKRSCRSRARHMECRLPPGKS